MKYRGHVNTAKLIFYARIIFWGGEWVILLKFQSPTRVTPGLEWSDSYFWLAAFLRLKNGQLCFLRVNFCEADSYFGSYSYFLFCWKKLESLILTQIWNFESDHSESMIVRKKSLLGSEPSWYCNTCTIYLFICIRITVFWQKSPGNSKLRIDSYFSKLQSNDSHF